METEDMNEFEKIMREQFVKKVAVPFVMGAAAAAVGTHIRNKRRLLNIKSNH